MTKEQKEYLKEIVKFKTLDPFKNEEYENKRLEELRTDALYAIKSYKDYKKLLKDKKSEEKMINELLKAIDLI